MGGLPIGSRFDKWSISRCWTWPPTSRPNCVSSICIVSRRDDVCVNPTHQKCSTAVPRFGTQRIPKQHVVLSNPLTGRFFIRKYCSWAQIYAAFSLLYLLSLSCLPQAWPRLLLAAARLALTQYSLDLGPIQECAESHDGKMYSFFASGSEPWISSKGIWV